MSQAVQSRRAFTLIELLIVVAIIAILAAIAVPNFLEAQVRSKVSRVKADMRTVATALESYAIDNNGKYPILNGYLHYVKASNCINRGAIRMGWCLSTPVAYLSNVAVLDPFCKTQTLDEWGDIVANAPGGYSAVSNTISYLNVVLWWAQNGGVKGDYRKGNRPKWFLVSLGPDYVKGPNAYPQLAPYQWVLASWGGGEGKMKSVVIQDANFSAACYDPSNGTISGGEIAKSQW